jgi:hypothetical protein
VRLIRWKVSLTGRQKRSSIKSPQAPSAGSCATSNGAPPQPDEACRSRLPLPGQAHAGPAVRATDRRHSLRLDVLTITRSACVRVRCAVVALWSEHQSRYTHRIRPASTKLDSILPTSSDITWLVANAAGEGFSRNTSVTKHIQKTPNDHKQPAFPVAKKPGNRCYPLTTTITV